MVMSNSAAIIVKTVKVAAVVNHFEYDVLALKMEAGLLQSA